MIQHVEFQASNEADFPFRMLEYWVYFRRKYDHPVTQCVFYIGNEPLRFPAIFAEARTSHSYDIVNLQEYDSTELLASGDWGDQLWALDARGDRPAVLQEILSRLAVMSQQERAGSLAG